MITTKEIYFAKKKNTLLFAARFLWNVVCLGDFFQGDTCAAVFKICMYSST